MNLRNKEKSIKNSRLTRYLLLAPVLISGLFLTGCVTDPYADDDGYRSSQGEYYGDYDDDGYIDEPNTQVEVYASSGSYSPYRSNYYDPYYARHYSGYYFDPFYGVYYSYGSGGYGAYGSYRSGYGYYCPLHHSYYGHSHYRSNNHRSHHRNVRRYDRTRDRHHTRNRDARNRNNVIQPDTEAVLSTRRGSGNRSGDRRNPRRDSNTSLGQRGLDGVIASRDRQPRRTRDRVRNRDSQGTSPRTRDVIEPTPNTNPTNRVANQQLSEARRRQIAVARAEHNRRAAANQQNQESNSQQERRESNSRNSSNREQSRERTRARSRTRNSSNSNRSRRNSTQRH